MEENFLMGVRWTLGGYIGGTVTGNEIVLITFLELNHLIRSEILFINKYI
jgi:hypothetical protein